MLIDWFTVGAQAVNFLVLVWLLKRYLYHPVLQAIDAREKKIAATIDEANARETKALAASEDVRKRSQALDQERESLMNKATEAAAVQGEQLLEAARQQAQALRNSLTQALAQEREELGRELSTRTQAEVFALARKALSDLAGVGLEDRMVEMFATRLVARPEPQQQALTAVPADATAIDLPRAVKVCSAFELSPDNRAVLESSIHERIGASTAIRFETSQDLICGIEFTTAGLRFAWSVADYLSALATEVVSLRASAAGAPALSQAAMPTGAANAQ